VSDTLRTERLTLVPLESGFVHVHDRTECAAAQEHWAEHGFGTWAILVRAGTFAGVAEVHYAHAGVDGISQDEIEVGWSILPEFRGHGFATEAMRAAILDVWTRAGIDHVVAYIRPENTESHRVAEKLGFSVRGEGTTRSGDPMTVYELRAA
jgi:RimJ/RimL family protein N-acetyltransferase